MSSPEVNKTNQVSYVSECEKKLIFFYLVCIHCLHISLEDVRSIVITAERETEIIFLFICFDLNVLILLYFLFTQRQY